MGYRRVPFAEGEFYHCFNRGIDKRDTFASEHDCLRFIQLLYLANDESPIKRENFYHMKHAEILTIQRQAPIVSVVAYCLMKNHYHLLLHEIIEGGIIKFMQKVGTGYAMYFNEKYDRIGNLFIKPFRSKHIDSDEYLRRVVQYIHLNPAELYEHEWKTGKVKNIARLEDELIKYPFSSLPDYVGKKRDELYILDARTMTPLRSNRLSLRSILREAAEYYADLEHEF
ncbi:transposase [Candidatus Kaiserbacteria bacterium]|nr:transposase [Candidatus Kaiserbacteria bacterium]